MDEQTATLQTLDLKTLVEKELLEIQKQQMSSQKVTALYNLFKTLGFIERLGTLPKEDIQTQKNEVMKALEVNIITEYTK